MEMLCVILGLCSTAMFIALLLGKPDRIEQTDKKVFNIVRFKYIIHGFGYYETVKTYDNLKEAQIELARMKQFKKDYPKIYKK